MLCCVVFFFNCTWVPTGSTGTGDTVAAAAISDGAAVAGILLQTILRQ